MRLSSPTDLRPFGRELAMRRLPLCPEIALWLLSEDVDLEVECGRLGETEAPPYWAFCWGAGQLLARHLLDHPAEVAGKRVLDLGTGSGVVAIAAALAGARSVLAVDNDLSALEIAEHNAAANGVSIETASSICEGFEQVLASDVYFEAGPREFCEAHSAAGVPVLVCEPDRPGSRHPESTPFLRAQVLTLPDVDSPTRSAALYRLGGWPTTD